MTLTLDTAQAVRPDDAVDQKRLFAYLKEHVEGFSEDAQLLQFHAGHSNLTYLVKHGDHEIVIKRAPPGERAKSAHDMGREFTVLSKLYGHYKFAPRALAYCEDASIAGSPFCAMERVSGIIVRNAHPPETSLRQVAAQFSHLIDALAELHVLDVKVVGLEGFGRPTGYRQRQVEGWIARLEQARTSDLADFSVVTKWLVENVPRTPEAVAVVHNDFKLDNLVWKESDITSLRAVLDWEMSTVGDPIFDLACTMSFWLDPSDPPELRALRAMPTTQPGVPSRSEAIQRYAIKSGRGIPSPKFLLCFGYFRRAAIEQQKYVRFRRGQTSDPRYARLNGAVQTLRDVCLKIIDGQMGA
jgi:aminoglycoside phosphotransferase (APT) family kinase protein